MLKPFIELSLIEAVVFEYVPIGKGVAAEVLFDSPSKALAPLYVQFVDVKVVPSGPVFEFL